MHVPKLPVITKLEFISPSIYEASLDCLAKAAWYAFGTRGVLPENPAAILGISFHTVIAAANFGELAVTSNTDRALARQLFDNSVRSLYSHVHPLVRMKFPTPEHLPFYNLFRERSAFLATSIVSSRLPKAGYPVGMSKGTTLSVLTESGLRSKDGLIVGRADYIDSKSATVVDYKSGYMVENVANFVSDSEARQLRLYAYLAIENGINVSKGTIVRGSGQRCELPITPEETLTEANNARIQLQMLNIAVSNGAMFNDLTSPSSQKCRSCPCIPFCDSFWDLSKPEWVSDCGSHVEGNVVDIESRQIQGISLTTLILSIRSGTIAAQRTSVEQIPTNWMTLDTEVLPRLGDFVRVVHGHQLEVDGNKTVIKMDKALTTVWCIPKINNFGEN